MTNTDTKWGYVYVGPDGEWHWSAQQSDHESALDQRPATAAEAEFASRIAAAPELLEALEAMVEDFGGFNTCEGPKPVSTQKAMAAIAKARGEHP